MRTIRGLLLLSFALFHGKPAFADERLGTVVFYALALLGAESPSDTLIHAKSLQ